MLAQREYYYTYFWNSLGWLHVHLGAPIPSLFLILYLAGLYATFLAVYLLAERMFRRPRVAFIALVFLLFARPSLAGVDTIEEILSTRQVATPLVLFALYLFLERRRVWAFT